jgi:(2Fe-2S) ferredoxin/predicted O-methyltransferase YrrM
MQPFRYHVMVCTQQKPENVPCCAAGGAAAVLEELRAQLGRQRLTDEVLVSTTGCLGACEYGPVMIVYPEAIWYGSVQPADVAEIVSSHLAGGRPVERLAIKDREALRKEILEHRRQYAAQMAARDAMGILPEDINEPIRGFMPARALLTALELDIFSAVGEGSDAAQVAAKLASDLRATEMLLNVLASLELLTKQDGIFRNTPATARFFCAGSPDDQRLGMMHQVHLWTRWSELTDCVRTGEPARAGNSGGALNEQETRAFIAAMDRNAKERAAQVASTVKGGVAGKGFRRMLDLGGGSAAYSIAFARVNPELRAEIIDRETVLPITREYIEGAGMTDRIAVRAGDMRTAEYGEGFDLVLISAIAHMFSPQENRELLRRIYKALAPGGKLVLQDFILDPDKTRPAVGAIFSLNMLVNTEGGASYSEDEYAEWLREAGFRESTRVRLPGPANLMIGVK